VYAFDLRNYAVAVHIWEYILRLAPNHPRANDIRTIIASIRKTPAKGTK
jgi:cytochrome c-type biogenesis protein CcmH/NrfG